MVDNFYGSRGSGEIDLRYELHNILYGTGNETPKAMYGLLRSMNLDSSGNLVRCVCIDKITHEPDKDYYCPICMGERYIWAESLVKFYRVSISTFAHGAPTVWNKTKEYGQVNIASHIFYFEFDTIIKTSDKIIDISLDLEGNIIRPIQREVVWKINDLTKFRADRGRVEFIKVFCNDEDVKYLQPPTINE